MMNLEQDRKKIKAISVGYIRVSISEDRQKLGYDIQKRKLKERGVDYIYGETLSGRKDDRPEFLKALIKAKTLAAKGYQVTFVVYKLDRFARKMSTILNVLEDLKQAGVNFMSLSENVDTSTVSGIMMMQLLGVFSEFEVNTIRARTREAMAQAKLEGKIIGRPPLRGSVKEKVAELYQKTALPVETIALRCNVSRRSVYRIVKIFGISRRKDEFNGGK
ncbi:recombinase family protein [Lacticaseibacillus casei]|uniref:recombinase family protein n=1 Tax=Lacticaseibacillus casei TaxID=1582 RepID=UPI001C394B4C|nr:recombinase family protein [Lacticaseibacillus casei]QXG60329.1 recombinase family protein [Lacticaseibacillus casei]